MKLCCMKFKEDEMERNIIKSAFLPVCLFILSLIAGCGSGVAPSDGSIEINPSSLNITHSGGTASTYTTYFTITVKDSEGNPLNGVDVSIFFPWANPAPSYVVQLYDGATAVNSPFTVKTDKNGIYNLRFDYLLGGTLDYKGDLEVRSGSVFATSTVTVTASSTSP